MFELAPRLRHSLASRTGFNQANVTMHCPACGGEVDFGPRVTLVDCAHCLTPLLRGPDDEQPLAPTHILPFDLTEEVADARLRQHVPKARSTEYVLTWARCFIPFWHFALHVRSPWRHESQSYDSSRDGYVKDVDSGLFEADIDHRFVAARLEDDRGLLATLISPALEAGLPYEPSLLRGISVLPVTIGLDEAWTSVRARVDARVEEAVKEQAGLWVGLPQELVTDLSNERAALVLVPVFVGTGRDGATTDRFLLDGYTGKDVKASTAGGGGAKAPARDGAPGSDVSLGVALLVLGGLAAAALLLLWGAFLLFRTMFAVTV